MFLRIAGTAVLLGTLAQSAQEAKSTKDSKSTAAEQVVYTIGGDVKPPKVVHYVEPDFSPSSQEAWVEGVVRISAIVNVDGVPSDLKIVNGLNAEEDKTAVAALKEWRFKPGTKNGQAVRVKITVEINFHLL